MQSTSQCLKWRWRCPITSWPSCKLPTANCKLQLELQFRCDAGALWGVECGTRYSWRSLHMRLSTAAPTHTRAWQITPQMRQILQVSEWAINSLTLLHEYLLIVQIHRPLLSTLFAGFSFWVNMRRDYRQRWPKINIHIDIYTYI